MSTTAVASDGRKSFFGAAPGEQFGLALAQGDFNNDGIQDLVTASPFYSTADTPWRGKVTIMWGGSQLGDQKTEIFGHRAEDQFGASMVVGDLNADGIDDLIVSSHQADEKTTLNNGRVYIFWGEQSLSAKSAIFVQDSPINIKGANHNSKLGLAMATGDINGDNIDDLILSAPNLFGVERSHVYALFGSATFPRRHIFDIDRESNLMMIGPKSEFFGSSLSVADVNGDDIGDILIGAYLAPTNDAKEVGKVYVIQGRTMEAIRNQRIEYDIVRYPHLAKTIAGKSPKEWFGFSLNHHDINNDGNEDIVASSFSFLNTKNGGKINVIWGDPDFFEPTTIILQSHIQNTYAKHLLGATVAIGDFLKNGAVQFITSAIARVQSPPDNVGTLFAIDAEKIVNTESFELGPDTREPFYRSEYENSLFGSSLVFGDFNNDQLNDIAVGAPFYGDDRGSKRGSVTILFGGPSLNARIVAQAPEAKNEEVDYVRRGEFITQLVEALNVKEREKAFLTDCDANIVFCLLHFSLQSSYAEFALEPELKLYPDIANSKHRENIILMTKLGLIHGFFAEDSSPFKPEEKITKMQALKVIMGTLNEVQWRFKFELKGENETTPFNDVTTSRSHMWWYPRYITAALKAGIIKQENYGDQFGPDDYLTQSEFDKMLESARNRL